MGDFARSSAHHNLDVDAAIQRHTSLLRPIADVGRSTRPPPHPREEISDQINGKVMYAPHRLRPRIAVQYRFALE